MSLSYWVEGIVPPDEKWYTMNAVWVACKVAGVSPPEEVVDFFNGEDPDSAGVVITLTDVKDYNDNERYASGYVVDLETLPKHIKQLRFVIGA